MTQSRIRILRWPGVEVAEETVAASRNASAALNFPVTRFKGAEETMAASRNASAALNFPVARFEGAEETVAASRNASAVINSARPIQNLSKSKPPAKPEV